MAGQWVLGSFLAPPAARSPFLRYGSAVLSVALALGLMELLGWLALWAGLGLCLMAVMVSTWVGGLGPGLLASILSALTIAYFLLPPLYALTLDPTAAVVLGLFALLALLMASLTRAQRAAQERAEAAVQMRDQFLATASHDLKSPLTTIKGYAQLLQRQAARAEGGETIRRMAELAGKIEGSAVKMEALLQELVDVAHLEVGQALALDRQPTDLGALATRVAAEQQQRADGHSIQLQELTPQVIGEWDALRLERVLENVVTNAIKYSPPGAGVIIRVGQEGDLAVLQVQDQGVGIPAAEVPHIFEPFYRGRQAEGHVGGTGLGLLGARQIVEQHGGTIQIESQEERGTTVTVRLPLNAGK